MIRNATQRDVEQLVVLIGALGYRMSAGEVAAKLERLLSSPESGVLVADQDDTIAGLATFHVFELISRARPECRLTALVVAAAHRRRGIGTALVAAVERVARERGCFRLELTTRVDRSEAHRFYAALGFIERPHRLVKALE